LIEQLCIENVALIEKQEINFSMGLNVLSGETGAGKTMIIDSINFLLGGRTSREFIRKGSETASVSGLIRLNQNILNIETDEDGGLHLRRTINSQGKGVCRVNGQVVTLGMLREISVQLADVHGQHEHQSLLNPAKHIALLDKFFGTALERLKGQLNEHIRLYKELTREITELSGGKDREARLDILRFQRDEIETAALKPGEEEELTRRRLLLTSSEKLTKTAEKALEALEDGGSAAVDNVARAKTAAEEIAKLDISQQELAYRFSDAYSLLDDLARDLRKYYDSLEYDPRELIDVETRLDLIFTLKRKYGGTVESVIEFGRDAARQIELIENSEEKMKFLIDSRRECTKNILKVCEEISGSRSTAASQIQRHVESELRELGMIHSTFKISIERKKEFSSSGYDRVEFLIAPNQGEGIKPLAKIASGGEMSRIMLAIKVVLADADSIDTFIFDEIDAGVSGRTAQKVAEKLALITKNRQILCITHLPQIAAMADRHFLIDKKSDSGRTATSVVMLDEKESVAELARLLGGAKITEATMKAAGEMREMAGCWKLGINNV